MVLVVVCRVWAMSVAQSRPAARARRMPFWMGVWLGVWRRLAVRRVAKSMAFMAVVDC